MKAPGFAGGWLLACNRTGKAIRVLTLATMNNSPSQIQSQVLHHALKIRRNFYPSSKLECFLCLAGQPLVNVANLRDFSQVADGQLTPLDFWEMVADSKALKHDPTKGHNGEQSYRVISKPIVQRYSQWLQNVIRVRVNDAWPNLRIDVICAVDESESADFVSLASRVLTRNQPVRVKRESLIRITPRDGLPDGILNPFAPNDKVWIVDDGCNSGNTLRQLIGFLRAARAHIVGALVLDSRLDNVQKEGIQQQMSGSRIVALYTWPQVGRGS